VIDIEIVNNAFCRVNSYGKIALLPLLSFTAEYWKKGRFKKERQEYQKHVLHKVKGMWYFHRGLLSRIFSELDKSHIEYNVSGNGVGVGPDSFVPKIKGIENREYQMNLVRKIRRNKRGVIRSATGSGKTVMQALVASTYRNGKVLVLAHTIDIVAQTVKRFKEYGLDVVTIRGNDSVTEENFQHQVAVGTVQTLNNVMKNHEHPKFEMLLCVLKNMDVVMVDECHHVSTISGSYARVLEFVDAPIRVGFTGTTPPKAEGIFALEGLLGPIIGELTIKEGELLGILAKPKVKLIKVPISTHVRALRIYHDVYQEGVVRNDVRNRLIVDILEDNPDKTALILVDKIEHGMELEAMAQEAVDYRIKFVHGGTKDEDRLITKDLLNSKLIPCAITTKIWKEGVDIPSLDIVINAAGGKSEISTLQFIGRGLRKTSEKDTVIIYDFFDPSHYYLISHFGERITLYMENNWL